MSDAKPELKPAVRDERIAAGLEQLRGMLVPGETLSAWSVQRRIFALAHRRTIVAATSGRFIGMTRGLLGGFHPVDFRWQDLREVKLSVGILGAGLSIVAYGSPDLATTGQTYALSFGGLAKEGAQAVYRIAQAQEQAWREKRRVRELEELRAKSGGIQLGSSGQAGRPGGGLPGAPDDVAARLQQAKEMLDKGLISDSEYESIKARILSSL